MESSDISPLSRNKLMEMQPIKLSKNQKHIKDQGYLCNLINWLESF